MHKIRKKIPTLSEFADTFAAERDVHRILIKATFLLIENKLYLQIGGILFSQTTKLIQFF